MAQMWLDVARYGDSDGYLNDSTGRLLHPYRDWVISAFARNIPYDQFVTWQVAGDLLPQPTTEQMLATSFLRMGKRNNEGGIIDEEFRVEYVNERAELMGKAFMGLTVACARCHDHKYDVISQRSTTSSPATSTASTSAAFTARGATGAPMGPTLAWPTPKQTAALLAAHEVTKAKQSRVRRDAGNRAQGGGCQGADADRKRPARRSRRHCRRRIDAGLEAYYPLDSTYVASFESLMIGPTRQRCLRPPPRWREPRR